MKKKVLLATMAVGALSLAACSTGPLDEAEPTLTTSASPASQTLEPATPQVALPTRTEEEIIEEFYLETLREEGITVSKSSALLVVDVTCEFMAEGGDPYSLFFGMALEPDVQVVPGVSNEDLPFMMGAAVGGFCPEYSEAIQ